MAKRPGVLTFNFKATEVFPNNDRLPVLVYKQALADAATRPPEDIARWFESMWPRHGWKAAWRFGIYEYPHYHSTAHELLGIYRGRATLRLGDKAGVLVLAEVGDLLVLPAGTVHQNVSSSADFHVVGGYPEGQEPDLLTGELNERPAADERIAAVPLPRGDPLTGGDGVLVRAWALEVNV